MLDEKIGNLSTRAIQIVAAGHPHITLSGPLANAGPCQPGTIMTKSGDELTPWDGNTGEPVGVLTESVESGQISATYLAHGMVAAENLKLASGNPPTAAQIFTLHKIGIYGA